MQSQSLRLERLSIDSLPIIDDFIEKMELARFLREQIRHERSTNAILLLVKSILVRPSALYRVQEWARGYDPTLVDCEIGNDDTIGRALDRLFNADRATLLTRCVLQAVHTFAISTDEIHNDSTTVTFSGNYKNQKSKGVQLKRGHNKDHRPDLKQLVYSLSTTADGTVPIHCNILDGNVSDDTTHWDTWQALRGLLGRSDFIYVADSKLCVKDTLLKIDRAKGVFITIVPRTRSEVSNFYTDLFHSKVRWEKILNRKITGKTSKVDILELAAGFYQLREGFRVFWYRSSQKADRDRVSREERIARAKTKLKALVKQKKGPRTITAIQKAVDTILARYNVQKYIIVSVEAGQTQEFKQTTRGKPNKHTTYKKIIKSIPKISCRDHVENIARAQASDGVFPLCTNSSLDATEVLKKYKHQPMLEKRHSLMKSVLEVAPIFLKSNTRIDALVFVYFIAQLIASLVERQIRLAMKQQGISALSILPENRPSKHPSANQILTTFEGCSKHRLYNQQTLIKDFCPDLTKLQSQILSLLNISEKRFQ